jgi:hypothetical protein
LPDVVPRAEVVTMNSIASAVGAIAAFLGANFMLVPRALFGSGDAGAASVIFLVIVPLLIALLLSLRFSDHVLGPDDTGRAIHGSAVYAVVTGWLHGIRTVLDRPTVAATLSGLAAHRMVFGINSLVVLLLVRNGHTASVSPLGSALLFVAAAGAVRRWGRYATANGALAVAAVIEIGGAGLQLWVLVVGGFLLGGIGQVLKLCADTAIQIDVDDALRGHVFAVQDSLFWVAFLAAITGAAVVIPADGHSPMLIVAGSVVYLLGLAAHSVVGRAANR